MTPDTEQRPAVRYEDLETYVPEEKEPALADLLPQCGSRAWLDYEDETGFGQAQWECTLRAGHSGKHGGWRVNDTSRPSRFRRLLRWLGLS